MSSKLLVLLLIAIFALTNAGLVNLRDCAGVSRNRASNVTLDVPDCGLETNNVDTCKLVKGNTYFFTTKFTPTANTSGLKTKAWGLISGIKVPYGATKKVCSEVINDYGPSCEENKGLVEGYEYRHVFFFPVRRFYPEETPVVVRIKYYASRRHTVACMEFPVTFVSGRDYH